MAKNKLVIPFIKWVGGKRQLLENINTLIPNKSQYNRYIEPFIGGGAVFFNLQPTNGIINDYNSDLINVYKTIKDNVEGLIVDLEKHKNTPDYFYEIREIDRSSEFNHWNNIQKASRFIYLNKTCYNGLYRVNNSGQFNSPFGKYKNPNIINEPILRAVSKYLLSNNIIINNKDYKDILETALPSDFIYLDPPYHPVSETSNFTGYIPNGWKESDQIELKLACDSLNERGIHFLLSNSSSDFIKNLYSNYKIHIVEANRSINSIATLRGSVEEVLITNY